jgi:hypothetical protein
MVVGEAGIGKSRLLEELAERARGRGFACAWGRGWELGKAPSFWPWLEMLRTLLARPLAPPGQRESLRALLPELSNWEAPPRSNIFELADALIAHLRAHAAAEPLALFVDDLHAVDPSSLELMELVLHGVEFQRIAMFSTRREHVDVDVECERRLARLARLSDALTLERLTADDVAVWVRKATGMDDARAAHRIHETSEGNPLFVRELLLLPHSGERSAGELPLTLRSLFHERSSVLSPAPLDELRAAALLGREFSLALLGAVTGATSSELEGVADEARRLGLLTAAQPGFYRFTHVLVAEALAQELPGERRAVLHARAAEALERRHRDDPLAPEGEIARHWLGAGVEAAPRASAAAERAARQAMSRLAFADAAALYEGALAALAASESRDVERQGELLVRWVEALARAERRERAEAVCAQAVELARARRSGPLLARAALALGAEPRVGEVDGPVKRLLAEAWAALPDGDDPLVARVMARLASARQPELDPEGPMQLARAAIAMARRIADPALTAEVIHAALGALMDFAPAEERAELNAEALELGQELGDRPRALLAARRLAFDRLELVDPVGFEQALGRYETLASELHRPAAEWVPVLFRSMRAEWRGEFERARNHEEQARHLRERGGGEGARLVHARPVARALARRDPVLLEACIEKHRARMPDSTAIPMLEAVLHGWRDDRDRVRRALDVLESRGYGQFRERGAPRPTAHGAGPEGDAIGSGYIHMPELAVEVACAMGDARWAEALILELAPSTGKAFVLTTTGFTLHGFVDHALLRLNVVMRRWPAAERHAAAALAAAERLEARPLLAWIQHDRAVAALAQARGSSDVTLRCELTERASAWLHAANVLARDVGLDGLEERCRAALVPYTAELPAPNAASDRLHLTFEGEYWTLRERGALCRVQDNRGMHMLARLVEEPGRALHVLDLSGSFEGVDGGDAGELVDERARDEYRARLRELRVELEEAESFHDLGRRERLEEEVEALAREISRGTGLGGRPRRNASAVERARVNVRRRLSLALRRIQAASPAIGERLAAAVRTGAYCVYEPRP